MTAESPDAIGFELGNDGPSVIVAAVDGSPTSLRAAAYAAGQSRRQGTRLVVVYVGTTSAMASLSPAGAAATQEVVDEVEQDVRAQVVNGAASVGIDVSFESRRGDAYQEIVAVCDDVRADAVVVGASSSIGHKLVGSLAVRLVRAAKWPVTVVP